MSKEEKELLLKDLCTRLPYRTKVHIIGEDGTEIDADLTTSTIDYFESWTVQPYLRPMSSMTEEERDELYTAMDWYGEIDVTGDVYTKGQEKVYRETFYEYTDWLISHHFDFRGLIPMGLALEAPNDMYKEK